MRSLTSNAQATAVSVPFYRPELDSAEVEEVVSTLRSGWLTTGPKVKRFEAEFAASVNASHAVAMNSCTAALHLAVEALGLRPGQGVLVPTMTFAATAEVVRYQQAIPILVDTDPDTNHLDLVDAEQKLAEFCAGSRGATVVGMIPVHVGGLMLDVDAVSAFARRHALWVIEDAAHAFPAAWRTSAASPWQRCGERTAAVTCFSFYANKTITTGEGGMAVTADEGLAERMRLMSLHGLSRDAWSRYEANGHWDYRIIAPGFKYNLTDIAAAIGIHQLARAERLRQGRERIAAVYFDRFASCDLLELPPTDANRIHSWHLFPIRLRLERLRCDRNQIMRDLATAGITCSVHWRPLHLHPYYAETFGVTPEDCPRATAAFERLISLPLYPSMTESEIAAVVDGVTAVLQNARR